jgi:hypothetical protein
MSIEWKNQRGYQGARVAWHQLTFFGCNIIVCRFCESLQRAVYLIQKKKIQLYVQCVTITGI